MKSFAIVLVCYNRINGIKRLIKSLENVNFDNRNDITLIFSIDNSGTKIVEDFAYSYKWPYGDKVIRTFEERQGLKKHILSCGDYTFNYDIVTMLEDDIYVSNSFYYYAYHAALFYENDDNVAGISLYNFQKNWLKWELRFEPQSSQYDTYFLKVAQSWGQVWQKTKWQKFKEWYNQNEQFVKNELVPEYLNTWPESSWLKYHDKYCIETNKYFVYPYISVSTNFSDIGEHALIGSTDHQVELMWNKKEYKYPNFDEHAIIYDEYMNRENLGKYLDISNNDLCVDFWSTKGIKLKEDKRYLLTTDILNYPIINSYELALRPIEMSVIKDIKGAGIYLYDTATIEADKKIDTNYDLMIRYSTRMSISYRLLLYSIKSVISNIMEKISRKMKCILGGKRR